MKGSRSMWYPLKTGKDAQIKVTGALALGQAMGRHWKTCIAGFVTHTPYRVVVVTRNGEK